ncbi:MAG: DUF3489 domain-containing protein [Phenylobacterium sp.]|nr:MAG: DUF3489 domain-containing protein [Phenylobacterium sp.]
MPNTPEAKARARKPRAANPAPAPAIEIPKGKLGQLVTLMARPQGATLTEMMTASGWQAHSVRGVIAGAVKRKLGLEVVSLKTDGARTYRISAPAAS